MWRFIPSDRAWQSVMGCGKMRRCVAACAGVYWFVTECDGVIHSMACCTLLAVPFLRVAGLEKT